ncbi:TetR/AcrR family transcriptional regulator [Nocardia cyriacigeorgica]|uniref:TetR/AcrR family transcriptional regulator n=1 Tax=Nocardia cyriacigeorgica TaxID=135487 RepID=UPI0013B9BDD7|nr:TetR/AcrR family transcriptional regulator [Nocardia cyriacigeorgica]NEW51484.1 TetR/AcrR family transcriptional regulator [Nocardia cyriacigeorgica]
MEAQQVGVESTGRLAELVARLRSGVPLDKLSPESRRHGGLSGEDVRTDQRWRLLGATAYVVATHGYWPATIQQIVDAAKVSKKTFYKHFSSKEEAFLAAFEVNELVIAGVRDSIDFADLDRLLDTMIGSYLAVLQLAPEVTEMLLFQPLGATPAIRSARTAAIARYTAALQQAFADARQAGLPIAELSDAEITMLLGAINELCVQHIDAHGLGDLPAALHAPLAAFVERVLSIRT